MKQISVSIDKIIIEYTKVSMDFWNGYFMKNICDYYGINPTIHELGFKYQLHLVNPDGTYMHVSFRPTHESKSKHYSLWIETHPEYLGGFKNILKSLDWQSKDINFVSCDVAYDIPVSPSNVFISSRTGRNMNWNSGTRYFGRRKTSKKSGYCRVYDKSKELSERKQQDVKGELTRVEMVYRPDSFDRFSIFDLLSNIPNFNKLYTCRIIDSLEALKPDMKAQVLAVQKGEMTLKEFSPYKRKKIGEALDNQHLIDFNELAGQNWYKLLSEPIKLIYKAKMPF